MINLFVVRLIVAFVSIIGHRYVAASCSSEPRKLLIEVTYHTLLVTSSADVLLPIAILRGQWPHTD